MVDLSSLHWRQWSILEGLDQDLLDSVELVHVFGNQAESAYFITSNDDVFAIGQNILGRIGIGEALSTEVPVKLDLLCGKSLMCFASATTHSLALSKSGDVYAWGSNNFGQIGNGTVQPQDLPCRVHFPKDVKIIQIATADRYCLALAADHKLYHWGDILWDSAGEQSLPILVNLAPELTITYICCGAFHAAAVTDCGKVLTWGGNEAGQLGNGETEIQTAPDFVLGQIEDQFIVKVTCTILATVALTKDGILYAWGHNKYKSLSVGFPEDVVSVPQRVIFRKNIIDVASNNIDSVICAEAENPHEVYIWAFDDDTTPSPQKLDCNSILEGFAGRAMPIAWRKILVKPPPIHDEQVLAPVRDIGKALFNKKELSDLTIMLADGEIYVHSLIMKTFSEHFKTLLAENWSNGNTTINMTQYNPNAYKAFLKFVYTGLLEPLEGTEIIALCDIAVSYFEHDLKDLCIQMFKHCLTVQNVVQLYSLAVGSLSELVESCIQFTSHHLEAVILSQGFETLDPVLSKSLILNAVKYKNSNSL